MSDLEFLRTIRADRKMTSGEVFDAVFAAGSILSDSDREDEAAMEIAIRLLEARRNDQVPDDCHETIDFLAEECGLYPYIKIEKFNYLTQTIIEAHAVQLEEKLYLHSKQMQVLLWLLDGDSVVLSAPTSFGKSLLIDAFLAKKCPHVVVVLLPTIALIDETRRRFQRTFKEKYRIISTKTETYDASYPTIFVLTQERFLQRNDNFAIDLLFVDEFYKLDPNRDDGRFETLNLALYRALPRAKQSLMAGPHIRNIELGEKWTGNFRFIRTDYRTVTVNIIDRSNAGDRYDAFVEDVKSVGNESSLVFTATPSTAQTLMNKMILSGVIYSTTVGSKLGEWIKSNYHDSWPLADGNKNGIAIHHGRLPRSLGQLFVHLFNEKELKILICTSTLIEGVNTSAENVFIYDKKINRTDFDFFSFTNIRGRVGRMMRHFIGNAFLYHEQPAEVETQVRVPILNDPGSASDFIVMNVERSELSAGGKARQDNLPISSRLSATILREHGALGIDLLMLLRDRIEVLLADNPNALLWRGFPDLEQRKALADLALLIAHKRRDPVGLHTKAQIGWAWSQLKQIKTLPKFLRWFVSIFDQTEGIDAAFQFLQACEFSFPRTLAAAEAILLDLMPGSSVSYGLYIAELETWFRPAWMKELDEAGIPLPLAERLAAYIRQPSGRVDALELISDLDLKNIVGFTDLDLFIVSSALR